MKQIFINLKSLGKERYGILFSIVVSLIILGNFARNYLGGASLEKRNLYLFYQVFFTIASLLFTYSGNDWDKIERRGTIYSYIIISISIILIILKKLSDDHSVGLCIMFVASRSKTKYSIFKKFCVINGLIILGKIIYSVLYAIFK